MCSDIAIQIENLSKTYPLYRRPLDRLKQSFIRSRPLFHEVQALKPLSLEIKRGETLGIIGRNGSGKSTLLQLICGILQPTHGNLTVNGRISALLELGAGFNPDFTGHENIFINGAILGLSPEELNEKYESIIAFAGIGDFIHQPVKTYSSGMYVRLAFAVAVASDPDILVVDEALAVGDEAFQRKCYGRIREMQQRGGTILFVSHSSSTIVEVCDRVLLLEQGEKLALGSPKHVLNLYHKLIYAPKDKAQDVIESASIEAPAETHFDANMKPESQVIYESHGALIQNPRIETADGKPVNLLTRGGEYVYRFDVAFEKPAQQVRCGMMIKTMTGVELGGSSIATFENAIPEVSAGDILQIGFQFRAKLLPGTYFLNCGCSGFAEDRITFLHRITDAVMFKVLPEGDLPLTGMVDFSIIPKVTHA
ncbi:MAG: ABC transporter ATP-binding protein [Rickettsiales bacterium]